MRDILNRIVSQHGTGAWVVEQVPSAMDKDHGGELWKVFEYGRADGRYSQDVRVWGLRLHGR